MLHTAGYADDCFVHFQVHVRGVKSSQQLRGPRCMVKVAHALLTALSYRLSMRVSRCRLYIDEGV